MKILMVCLGNICRSPLAEGIFKHHSDKLGLGWQLDSAGTGGWHSGERPDHRSIQIARKNGIDLSGQRARQFQIADFDRFDRIFVMDSQNFRDVTRLARTEGHRQKVEMILNISFPGENRGVPDPYYDDDGFEAVFQMLDNACQDFIKLGIG